MKSIEEKIQNLKWEMQEDVSFATKFSIKNQIIELEKQIKNGAQ